MACLAAVLALVVFWAVNSGGSGGSGNGANGSNGHTPVSSITPGPSASGPLNSSRPGGSVGGAGGGSGDTGSTDGSSSSGGSSGGGATSSTTTGTGDTGGTSSGGSSSGGGQLPAGSTLPDCASGSVTLTLRSAQNSYEPGVKPQFKLTASNAGSTACKLDFGPTAAVFTVTDVDDKHVWASDDCPVNKSAYLLQVPAGSTTTYVVTWNRANSSPNCATPRGEKAATGTYLVQAKLSGFGSEQSSFVLKND